jgi:hypothetical protein
MTLAIPHSAPESVAWRQEMVAVYFWEGKAHRFDRDEHDAERRQEEREEGVRFRVESKRIVVKFVE